MSKAQKDPKRISNLYRFTRDGLVFFMPPDDPNNFSMLATNIWIFFRQLIKCFDPCGRTTENVKRRVTDETELHLLKVIKYKRGDIIPGTEEAAAEDGFYTEPVLHKIKYTDYFPAINKILMRVFGKEFDLTKTDKNDTKWRGIMFPLITYCYLMITAEQEIEYANNQGQITSGTTISSIQLTLGQRLANRFKRSRPEAMGILTNIESLKYIARKLSETSKASLGPRPSKRARGSTKVVDQRDTNSLDHLTKILQRQVICEAQREFIRDLIQDWNSVDEKILIRSFNVIKPRVVHKFVMSPDIIYQLLDEDLIGASLSSVWPYTIWNKYNGRTYLPTHENDDTWSKQVQFMMTFGAMYESLDVLNWMCEGKIFKKRKLFPTGLKQPTGWVKSNLKINYGCPALKGAPVNLGRPGTSVHQYATQPSFAGKRPKNDKQTQIAELIKGSGGPSTAIGADKYERLSNAIEEYKQIKIEGTSSWFEVSVWDGKSTAANPTLIAPIPDNNDPNLFFD